MKFFIAFCTVVLALCPITGVYNVVGGIGLDQALALVIVIVTCLHNPRIKSSPFLGILLSCIFLALFSAVMNPYVDVNLMVHNFFPITVVFLTLYCVSKNSLIKVGLFINTLYFFGTLATLVCLYQRIQLYTIGYYDMDVFIPGLELNRDIDTFVDYRPSAFFTEPAHMAIFLLPIFYLALKKQNFIFAFIMAGGIFISSSTTGFIMLGGIFVYYLYSNGIKNWLLYLIIPIAAFLIYKFGGDLMNENIDKLNMVESRDIRLLGAFLYMSKMNLYEWIFGVGLNQLEQFSLYKHIQFLGNYANAILYTIICYGVIGFSIMIYYIVKIWKSINIDKGFLLVFLGILATDQILFNRHFVYLVLFIILSKQLLIYNKNDL